MKIAIVTGASSGMGREFVRQLSEYVQVDEIWAVARRREALEALKAETTVPVRPVVLDLLEMESFDKIRAMLEETRPEIALLVNAAGFGKFGAYHKTSIEDDCRMIDLNCKALLVMTRLCIPYMKPGSHILELDSLSAFQPVPYITTYGATKAFVLSFSRALNRELRSRGIGVMAVCPFWTKTAFFGRAIREGEQPIVKKYVAMYDVEDIVTRTWRDAKRGKDVCKYGFIARAQAGLAKILPHSLVMDVWMKQQELR